MKISGAIKFVQNQWKIRVLAFFILLCFTFQTCFVDAQNSGVRLRDRFDAGEGTVIDGESAIINEIFFSQAVSKYNEKGYKNASGDSIILLPDDVTSSSTGDIPIEISDEVEKILNWSDPEIKWLEWSFEVSNEGLYEITFNYFPAEGTGANIERSIMINEEYPFREARNILFPRKWVDDGKILVNNIGDEVRPQQREARDWVKITAQDSLGSHSGSLRFYFKSGTNTLRLVYVNEPIKINKIELHAPLTISSYSDYLVEKLQIGLKRAPSGVKFQAEDNILYKSSPTIGIQSHSDPLCEPRAVENRIYNIVGEYPWHKGGEKITWELNVEEEGLYKIGLRSAQWWNDGLPSFRKIEINGAVPFEEMLAYQFNYSNRWRSEVLSDNNGNPYEFHFKKGKNTLSMQVVLGEYNTVIERIDKDLLIISKLIRQIIMITGNNPDVNYQYYLDRNIPGLIDTLEYLIESMEINSNYLSSLSTKRSSTANGFLQIQRKLNEMVKNPEGIPRRMTDLYDAVSSLGSWYTSIRIQPLSMDFFELMPENYEFEDYKANVFQNIIATIQNFIISFFKDYDNVSSVFEDQYVRDDKPTLDVWIARGTEWAEVIKELSDSNFTKDTGIGIKMNILPASQLNAGAVNALMLAVSSGRAPDAALSVSAGSPVEFAIRGAVADISKFERFDETVEQFLPKLMIPFEYMGGVYALPETMNFRVLFYRSDILDELNMTIPDTWDDLYQNVFPVLYQNGMQFHFAPDLSPFLYQNGGTFYSEDGFKTALDSPQAYQSFKQLTELYVNYGVPAIANFFNRFRTGDMPIGVEGYATYVMLSVAAPELRGRWSIAPIPGTIQQDGTIDRSYAGLSSEAAIVLNQSEYKKEAWEFIRWWTSENIQTTFGRQIESIVGVEARWNTANINAFRNLPWNPSHLKEIEHSFQWGHEIPVVLGGYFTGREIMNAWNRVVIRDLSLGGKLRDMNTRDSLELAVKNINKELAAQQAQYGFLPINTVE